MGSVNSISPVLANLLQTLSDVNSPVLSSPNAVSALENASPADIINLSAAATQLQGVDILFGGSGAAPENTATDMSSMLANLEASLTDSSPATAANSPNSSTSASAGSPASQLADYQTGLQAVEADALLGLGSTGTPSGSLFDVLA
jgi:hypothetical protein